MNQTAVNKAKETFKELFGSEGKLFFCPGRINLIGDHIDYNGGWVLPAAISMGTYAVAQFNGTNTFRIFSCNFDQALLSIDLSNPDLKRTLSGHWASYVVGSLLEVEKANGITLKGMDLVFNGDIPRGSGLSSSASLEVLVCYLVCYFHQLPIQRTKISIWGQAAENEFVGMNCGIMDQFAVANGRQNQALLLDCQTLQFEYVPVELGNFSLVVMNSCKPRKLVESKYNERRQESELALEYIRRNKELENLAQADLEDIELLQDEKIRRRAKHVITENKRVLESVNALRTYDLKRFGQLLTESHESLKTDYETSGAEMDQLVKSALQNKDCLGARMMGGGFGGCALALVNRKGLEQFMNEVEKNYSEAIGYQAEFYIPELADGVKHLD
jgi:galactokinase